MDILKMRKRIADVHVLVVGDIMLDKYIYGLVTRISPEAPIPVVKVTGQKAFLGGAANVAAGVCALGARATLLGVIGEDAAAAEFSRQAAQQGIAFIGINTENRRTTIKTRVVGNNSQIVRFDEEECNPINDAEVASIIEIASEALKCADVLVISDYAKGVCTTEVCTQLIQMTKRAGKIVIVDPKLPDWNKFNIADILTPNFEEFKASLGMRDLENSENAIRAQAPFLINKHQLGGILVTRSKQGMTFVSDNEQVVTAEATAKEVYDVSGAGDTVTAAMSVFSATGIPIETTISLSNMTAGIAVSKPGTYPVSFEELASIAYREPTSKLYTLPILDILTELWKKKGKRIVFTNGCFDILHSGHISLLDCAKQEGDILVLGINSDSSVRRLKGNGRPVNTEHDRITVIASLSCVDAIIIFDEDTPLELIQRIKPDVLVKGGDYSIETVVGADFVRERGGKVLIVPLVPDKSTTKILSQVRNTQHEK